MKVSPPSSAIACVFLASASFVFAFGAGQPASAQVGLTAVERLDICAPSLRVFDVVIDGLAPDQKFAAAEIRGTSARGDFRNPDATFNFAFCFNECDSFMTAPPFCPDTELPATRLIGAPTNSFTSTSINWAWADDPNAATPGLGGVIARVVVEEGGMGILQVAVAGTFVGGGSWASSATIALSTCCATRPALYAVENPAVNVGQCRAFDLVLTCLAPNQRFVGAEIIGMSSESGFCNPDSNFEFAICTNSHDSFMTAPPFCPNVEVPATRLIAAPTNSITPTSINWAWVDDPDAAIPGLGGVVARIMLASGTVGILDVQVAGTFSDRPGSWSAGFHVVLADSTWPIVALATPAGSCISPGSDFVVDVNLEQTNGLEITGGQFFLLYDPDVLTFQSADPGGASDPNNPFDVEIPEEVDPIEGTIDYVVQILPGGAGATQPMRMARLTFTLNTSTPALPLAVVFRTHDPSTRLAANIPEGGLEPFLYDLCVSALDQDPPTVNAPADISTFADAGQCRSVLTAAEIGSPTVSDECTADPADIVVTFERSDGRPNLTDPFDSADSPVEIVWTATDPAGNQASDVQTVTVEPFNVLWLDLQLQPFFDDPNPTSSGDFISRCIELELTNCAGLIENLSGELSLSVDSATNPEFNGRTPAPVMLLVPCGSYTCVTSRDSLHSVRRTLLRNDGSVGFRVIDRAYEVNFAGPNRWLTQGNLTDLAGEDVIDILDFGVLINQFRRNYGSGDTDCQTAAPHADIDGDAIVGVEDFTFIASNFFATGDASCCSALGGGRGRASVTLEELNALGLGQLGRADLNGDGVVDIEDVMTLLEEEERRLQSLGEGYQPDGGHPDNWDRRLP